METAQLATASYWESGKIDLRLNPRREFAAGGLLEFLSEEVGIRHSVVMATSGSSGDPKFVVLSKEALLASARAVAAHLDLSAEDSWLAGLSDFHVGGLGMFARAYVTGAAVTQFERATWERDGGSFVRALRDCEARWTSLTPTHLHDLVIHKVPAPASLRGVLLGGGRIDPVLVDEAMSRGWPVHASYGMTEACSQIATGSPGESTWLPILPGWETELAMDGRLRIRGEALFSGYAMPKDGGWSFDGDKDREGWFITGDRCELREGKLRHCGRADDLVKVLGELVSVSAVESRVSEIAARYGLASTVVAMPEDRRGHVLVAVLETNDESRECRKILSDTLTGLERLDQILAVEELPRTDLGKIDRAALRDSLTPS